MGGKRVCGYALPLVAGAVLKGAFSRYDYQRSPNSGLSSVKSYTTILPASATDVYYRDEIGNISTSHLRSDEDFTEVILRPRYTSSSSVASTQFALMCISLACTQIPFVWGMANALLPRLQRSYL